MGQTMADGDLSETIEQAATKPESASVDGVSAKARSLTELIEADKHLASKRATADFAKGFCRMRIVPPGSV